MTRAQLIRETYALYREKGLECSTEELQILLAVCHHLAWRGVAINREVLDFAVDVIRVKDLLGLPPEPTQEEVEETREKMADWLEALGWRRDWFTRPLEKAR
jgi:hypothetical protein